MTIKKLFNSEKEYLDYVWSFINFDANKIWREEDLPKLQPYFDLSRVEPDKISHLSENEKALLKKSMLHYKKCSEEYADELFEIRDIINQFDIHELADFFFLEEIVMDCYDIDEDGNDIDEEGNIMPPLSRETIKISEVCKEKMTFPFYFVGYIVSDFDRYDKIRIAFSEFVSLKDFEEVC